jgi:predicted  nucleic acid-binding Zn-ribbon protein
VQNEAYKAQQKELATSNETITTLKETIAVLELKTRGLERDITAFSAHGSDQNRAIAEYAVNISRLETANLNQQQTLNRRDDEIVTLRSENSSKDEQLEALNSSIVVLRNQAQAVNTRASASDAALATQRSENLILQTEKDELQRKYNELEQKLDAAMKLFQ